MLYSEGGYKKEVKEALDWAAMSLPDSAAKWEIANIWEETQAGMQSFLICWDFEQESLSTGVCAGLT